MSILAVVYASAPTDEVLVPTLEILHPALPPMRLCDGYEDHVLTLETSEVVTFYAAPLDIALPAKNDSGQQNINFVVDNVMGDVQRAIDDILHAGGRATLVYREYLLSDLSAPAAPPITMTLAGGSLSGATAQLTASYLDILNTAWPRDRYTAEFAPGLKYQ